MQKRRAWPPKRELKGRLRKGRCGSSLPPRPKLPKNQLAQQLASLQAAAEAAPAAEQQQVLHFRAGSGGGHRSRRSCNTRPDRSAAERQRVGGRHKGAAIRERGATGKGAQSGHCRMADRERPCRLCAVRRLDACRRCRSKAADARTSRPPSIRLSDIPAELAQASDFAFAGRTVGQSQGALCLRCQRPLLSETD